MQNDSTPMIDIAIGWIESVVALRKVPVDSAARGKVSMPIPEGLKKIFSTQQGTILYFTFTPISFTLRRR